MNKLYLAGAGFVAAMLGFTYVAMDIKGGLNGDIVNMLAILGAIALVIVSVFVVTKYVRQMQSDTAGGELAEENWDSIGEYKNPLPMGWAIIFLGLIVWAAWYFLAGYPVNAYSQIGEYNEDSAKVNAKFEEKYKNLSAEELHSMGESVFLVNCAPCHGLAADGMDGKAANLTKRLEAKSVVYVINHGSMNNIAVSTDANGTKTTSAMPDRNGLFNSTTNALITDAEIEKVANYVASGMKGDGADIFASTCSSCHGPDGKGMDGVAPNIANFTTAFVSDMLSHGKKGAIGSMPAFTNLNATQVKAVSTYITDISKGE
ncbi:MAG: c-type cytochrome [Thiovulaceae bacterium]|nr:c-type cytochrome [Sulfurimonadaceae bacterium]